MLTWAFLSWVSSASLRLKVGARAMAAPASVKVALGLPVTTTGALAIGVMVISTPAWLLVARPLLAPPPSRLASLTEIAIRRMLLVAVGSEELLLKVTARRAVS